MAGECPIAPPPPWHGFDKNDLLNTQAHAELHTGISTRRHPGLGWPASDFWILIYGLWLLDSELWMKISCFWLLQLWIPIYGFWIMTSGCWLFGLWLLEHGFGIMISWFWIMDYDLRMMISGLRLLDSAFWILISGFCGWGNWAPEALGNRWAGLGKPGEATRSTSLNVDVAY